MSIIVSYWILSKYFRNTICKWFKGVGGGDGEEGLKVKPQSSRNVC